MYTLIITFAWGDPPPAAGRGPRRAYTRSPLEDSRLNLKFSDLKLWKLTALRYLLQLCCVVLIAPQCNKRVQPTLDMANAYNITHS